MGERTFRATRDAIEYRELEPLTLKGKAEPVPAWEAVGVLAAQPVRRAPAPREARFVGRDDKLDLLDAATAGRARGPAAPRHGDRPGRRRQVAAAASSSALERTTRPRVREGRCLPYGSGIVYWALGEVMRAEAGSSTATRPTSPGTKLSEPASPTCWATATGVPPRRAATERKAAMIGRLLGIEAPLGRAGAEAGTPHAGARRSSPPARFGDRGDGPAQPARARASRTSTGPTTECST